MINNLAYMIYSKSKEWKNNLESINKELYNECLEYKKILESKISNFQVLKEELIIETLKKRKNELSLIKDEFLYYGREIFHLENIFFEDIIDDFFANESEEQNYFSFIGLDEKIVKEELYKAVMDSFDGDFTYIKVERQMLHSLNRKLFEKYLYIKSFLLLKKQLFKISYWNTYEKEKELPVERVIKRNEYLKLIDEKISKESGIFNLRKKMSEKIYFTFKKELLRDIFELKIKEFEVKKIACSSAFEFCKVIIPFHNVLTTFIDIKSNDNN